MAVSPRKGFGLLAMAAGLALFMALVASLVFRSVSPPEEDTRQEQTGEPSVPVSFHATSFDALTGWAGDDMGGVLETFLRSCGPLERLDPQSPFGGGSHLLPGGEPLAGRVHDWLDVCEGTARVPLKSADIRQFFEDNFTPIEVRGKGGAREGLFTGYYEPTMQGSRTPKSARSVPLLEKPDDLVALDLGDFRADLKGVRLAGRVVGGRLEPYEDRAAIEAGKLGSRARVLVWIDDPVDAFFLHIQGSGRVVLEDGETFRVGYAGQNGHPYVAIGKVLIERGFMTRAEVSMQSIRAWLAAHQGEAANVMQVNTSYVFFHRLDDLDPDLGPLGAGGTALTPRRSLAVDRTFHALGVPAWLETDLPTSEGETPPERFERLMIAQDTGGAIKGPVRGDIFFGRAEEGVALAGRMNQQGTLTLLLPKALAARLEGSLSPIDPAV